MKNLNLSLSLIFVCWSALFAFGQETVIINDPTKEAKGAKANAADENLIKNSVLPKARKLWNEEVCTEEFEIMGVAKGSFSKPASSQTLLLYQYCQMGNGFGNNGLVLIENGKIIRSYSSEGGWALDLRWLPDINQNSLDEFAVFYSGGMHQGQGGTGVDLMEMSDTGIKGIGWFNAESFTETSYFGYKVTVKTGKKPIFYREKYNSKNNKWRKSGKPTMFKLDKIYSKFETLK